MRNPPNRHLRAALIFRYRCAALMVRSRGSVDAAWFGIPVTDSAEHTGVGRDVTRQKHQASDQAPARSGPGREGDQPGGGPQAAPDVAALARDWATLWESELA